MDDLGYVRYFAFVVEGDGGGSGIMKSCFEVIVVNDVVGRVGGRSEPTVGGTVAASVDGLGDVPVLRLSSWRATRTAVVSWRAASLSSW